MKKVPLFSLIVMLGFGSILASQQFDDLAKLIKSGASETVVVAYIDASESSYSLSSDEIMQLKQLGATPNEIIAAIQHKGLTPASPNTQAAPPETTSVAPAPHVVYRAPSPWAQWRAARNYWYERVSKMDQAVQLDVIGLIDQSYTLNYEYLMGHRHGVVLEGNYYYNNADSHGENAELAYRLHLSNSMNAGFVGVFVKGGRYHDNEIDNSGDTIGYSQTSITVGPNIGKRWVSASGLSLVARVGYGFTWSKFDNNVPDQHTQDLLQERSGLDSELSLGWAF